MNEIFTRRSIRKYIDRPVEPEKRERILRAGMQAPSARNAQPWELLVITDPEDKREIARMSPYAKMVEHAPEVLVVCVNLDRTSRTGNAWWVEDLSACTQNILLQITAEGLGGVWLGFYPDGERVDSLISCLQLPENIIPFAVVAYGYGETDNVFVDRYDEAKVHIGRF